ncbi:hypothetical protein FHR70_004759 [Microvirga lupini]|uniref:Uncharacterized protein n=1 Tax=Microvirga lupini TaxID=420324 RepID=A0A7W4VQY7_9HYPH|nr:hypothetical protein [Microvirga lupini]MBB3021657.1 hypothetical protein [Microvirga lupini]
MLVFTLCSAKPWAPSSPLPGIASAAALDVATVGSGTHALLILEGMLASVHMACGALLHFLGVMARVAHVLLTELAFHDGLLWHEQEANVRVRSEFRSCLEAFHSTLLEPQP